MKAMKLYGLFFSLLILASCKTTKKATPVISKPLIEQWMTGSFHSGAQAAVDTNYYNISLHMYPIWEHMEGIHLYVEQALFEKQDAPYRVRIYKVIDLGNNLYESKVYKLKDEENFIGEWENLGYFNEYGTEILQEREGCSVFLSYHGGVFSGSTKDRMCNSSMRGARYATSKVTVSSDKIESWDQGFDSSGNQVWGATTGPYIFDRITN